MEPFIIFLLKCINQLSCVTKSCPTLGLHELQHTRLPCLSLSPRVCKLMSIESVMPSNHLVLCYPLLLLPSISPSIRVFSSDSAPCSGQSIGASAATSVLPMNIHGWFPLGLAGLIFLLVCWVIIYNTMSHFEVDNWLGCNINHNHLVISPQSP